MEEYAFLQKYNGSFGLDLSGDFSWEQVVQAIVRFAGDTLKETYGGILIVFGVCILAVFVQADLEPGTHNMVKYTWWILICVCAYPIVRDFLSMTVVAKEGISDITALMLSAVPALFSLPIASGAGVFLFITQVASALMLSIFLPLILCQTGLGVCDTITEHFTLGNVRKTMKNIFNWGLATMMLIFSITSTLSGVVAGAGATTIGRSLRHAGSVIPVVGRYLSESAEMIYSSGVALKSSLGIGVSIAVIGCLLAPFIRIMVYLFVYKILSFCIKPFGYASISALTDTISDGLAGLAGLTILTAAIGLINISVIIRCIGMGV